MGRPTVEALLARAVPAPNGCLEWQGATSGGYGCVRYHSSPGVGKGARCHRLILEAHVGRDLLPHEFALHTCDNPLCINVEHLYVGTAKDNMRDCLSRGRAKGGRITPLFGEANPVSKLTDDQAREIRTRRRDGEKGCSLASEFGVSAATVCEIAKGLRYPERTI